MKLCSALLAGAVLKAVLIELNWIGKVYIYSLKCIIAVIFCVLSVFHPCRQFVSDQ